MRGRKIAILCPAALATIYVNRVATAPEYYWPGTAGLLLPGGLMEENLGQREGE